MFGLCPLLCFGSLGFCLSDELGVRPPSPFFFPLPSGGEWVLTYVLFGSLSQLKILRSARLAYSLLPLASLQPCSPPINNHPVSSAPSVQLSLSPSSCSSNRPRSSQLSAPAPDRSPLSQLSAYALAPSRSNSPYSSRPAPHSSSSIQLHSRSLTVPA